MKLIPGFSESLEKEHSQEEDFEYLGARLPREILCPNGDWREYYPMMEIQRKIFDTYSCVSFANNNAEEMMHIRRYGVEVNRSDRFLSVVSGTVPGRGNSHKAVANAKKKKGIVNEDECPFPANMSQKEFFKPIGKELLSLGLKWKKETEYGYEKIGRDDFIEALKYSPIQVAVDSRTNKTSQHRVADHSIVLTHIDEVGQRHVYDSYLGRFKTYEYDYPFSYGMRFHYKQLINLTLDNMKMQLIRSIETGKIYLVDSDNRIHHVELEPDFKQIFGEKAWIDKDWVNHPEEVIQKYEEGVSLSSRKVDFVAQLKEMFNKFGSKF